MERVPFLDEALHACSDDSLCAASDAASCDSSSSRACTRSASCGLRNRSPALQVPARKGAPSAISSGSASRPRERPILLVPREFLVPPYGHVSPGAQNPQCRSASRTAISFLPRTLCRQVLLVSRHRRSRRLRRRAVRLTVSGSRTSRGLRRGPPVSVPFGQALGSASLCRFARVRLDARQVVVRPTAATRRARHAWPLLPDRATAPSPAPVSATALFFPRLAIVSSVFLSAPSGSAEATLRVPRVPHLCGRFSARRSRARCDRQPGDRRAPYADPRRAAQHCPGHGPHARV